MTQGLSSASLCQMWLAASWTRTWLETCSLDICSRGAGLSVHVLCRSMSDPIHMVVKGALAPLVCERVTKVVCVSLCLFQNSAPDNPTDGTTVHVRTLCLLEIVRATL